MAGLLGGAFFTFPANSETSVFKPITSQKKRNCTQASPCQIAPTGKAVFGIVFKTTEEDSIETIDAVLITHQGTKKTQTFPFEDLDGVVTEGTFALYAVHLRPGVTDLALLASDSARRGLLYHYFIYNDRTQGFVLSPDIPELEKDGKGRLTDGDRFYKLDRDLLLRPASK